MKPENTEVVQGKPAVVEVELCNLHELEQTLLEHFNRGWRMSQTRAYDLHREEKINARGRREAEIIEHEADVELDYLRQAGKLRTILAIGDQQAVAVTVFHDGSFMPNVMSMCGRPARISDLECVMLPSTGGPQLSWAYSPAVMSRTLAQHGFAGGELRLLDALTLLVARTRFRAQRVQLREVLAKFALNSERWQRLVARVQEAKLVDGDVPEDKATVFAGEFDWRLVEFVGQRLYDETAKLHERILKAKR